MHMSVRSLILLVSLFSLSSCFGMGVNSVPAPVYKHGNKSGAGSVGVHNVVGGDTLYSISNRYRLTMQDIVVVNRLKAPFILHEGQRLRLPPRLPPRRPCLSPRQCPRLSWPVSSWSPALP